MTNAPRQFVVENSVVNPEALNDWEIGSTVIVRQADAVKFAEVPFVADKAFPVMEYMDQVVEKRTGISRASMALDLDALQDQTATAINANQAAAHTKVEEYARNIAEYGGLKRVFSKILKLIVKHQDRSRMVRLRDGWIDVDPRAWNADMDVTINTGLGSGSRERDLTMLAQIAAKQEQIALQMGPINPICGVDRLMDTYRLMTEAAGLKPAERFFPEVTPQAMQQLGQMMQQQQGSDPKAAALQQQGQIEQQKVQMEAQLKQQTLQMQKQLEQQSLAFKQRMEAESAQRTAAMEQMKAQRDAEFQQLQLERQGQVEERQAQADIAVKQTEAQNRADLEQMKFAHEQQRDAQKFEFEKKLEMMKLWCQCKDQMMKRSTDQTGGGTPADLGQADFEDMLQQEGGDIPSVPAVATPLEKALAQMADSQAQIAQMMAACMQQMNEGHAQNSAMHAQNTQLLAGAVMEANKPKRQRVVRDDKNRVVGVETIQ